MSCICCGKLRCDDHDDDSWQRCAERRRARMRAALAAALKGETTP